MCITCISICFSQQVLLLFWKSFADVCVHSNTLDIWHIPLLLFMFAAREGKKEKKSVSAWRTSPRVMSSLCSPWSSMDEMFHWKFKQVIEKQDDETVPFWPFCLWCCLVSSGRTCNLTSVQKSKVSQDQLIKPAICKHTERQLQCSEGTGRFSSGGLCGLPGQAPSGGRQHHRKGPICAPPQRPQPTPTVNLFNVLKEVGHQKRISQQKISSGKKNSWGVFLKFWQEVGLPTGNWTTCAAQCFSNTDIRRATGELYMSVAHSEPLLKLTDKNGKWFHVSQSCGKILKQVAVPNFNTQKMD